jgi:hypothetical protein
MLREGIRIVEAQAEAVAVHENTTLNDTPRVLSPLCFQQNLIMHLLCSGPTSYTPGITCYALRYNSFLLPGNCAPMCMRDGTWRVVDATLRGYPAVTDDGQLGHVVDGNLHGLHNTWMITT